MKRVVTISASYLNTTIFIGNVKKPERSTGVSPPPLGLAPNVT
jgi:hypothetical protein